ALLPIAGPLHDHQLYFIDLPGFGRTPYHHEPSVIDGYVESVVAMTNELNRPVILVGHSFGGLIAARVMQSQSARIHQLLLLQPVLHPIEPKYRYPSVTERILKSMSTSKLKKELLKSNSF